MCHIANWNACLKHNEKTENVIGFQGRWYNTWWRYLDGITDSMDMSLSKL